MCSKEILSKRHVSSSPFPVHRFAYKVNSRPARIWFPSCDFSNHALISHVRKTYCSTRTQRYFLHLFFFFLYAFWFSHFCLRVYFPQTLMDLKRHLNFFFLFVLFSLALRHPWESFRLFCIDFSILPHT